MPGLENSYIMNTLKILARNKEERFQLCKEHKRELSLFCKGNQCGKVICQLCHLESHNGHNVVDVVKEHQKNIDKRLCYVFKKEIGADATVFERRKLLAKITEYAEMSP